MLKDIIQIKNFFDEPNDIIEFAKQQTYYNKEEFTNKTSHSELPEKVYPQWQGYRTEKLHLLNQDFFVDIGNLIIEKTLQKTFLKNNSLFTPNFRYELISYFHYMTEEEKYNDIWVHQDNGMLMGGLIYLTPNAPKESGTIIQNKLIENEFNKLVMFNGQFYHSPTDGFGKDINDARLTLLFFIKRIEFFN